MRSLGKLMVATIAVMVAGCSNSNNNVVVVTTDSGVEVAVFRVALVPSQETPPCPAAGALASGEVTVRVPTDGSSISVTGLTFSGLSGPATAAHIHVGARNVPGPIVFPLTVTVTPFSTVSFSAADYPSPVPAGASPDFPSFIEALRTGNTYVNVHTAACPNGEIRGQLL